jgi:hypothetical protein
MALPGFLADVTLERPRNDVALAGPMSHDQTAIGPDLPPGDGHVVAQLCTPCFRVGGGTQCFGIRGFKVCAPIPYSGTWRLCCSPRWGWPPVKNCYPQRC